MIDILAFYAAIENKHVMLELLDGKIIGPLIPIDIKQTLAGWELEFMGNTFIKITSIKKIRYVEPQQN